MQKSMFNQSTKKVMRRLPKQRKARRIFRSFRSARDNRVQLKTVFFAAAVTILLIAHFWNQNYYNLEPEAKSDLGKLRHSAAESEAINRLLAAPNEKAEQTSIDREFTPIRASLTSLLEHDKRFCAAYTSYADYVFGLLETLGKTPPEHQGEVFTEYRSRALKLVQEIDRITAHWRNSPDTDEAGKLALGLISQGKH